jgi:hypothetical protein
MVGEGIATRLNGAGPDGPAAALREEGRPILERPIDRIELTPNILARLEHFRSEIKRLQSDTGLIARHIAALEQGVFAMLATVVELHGAPNGEAWQLTPDEKALVRNVRD